MAIKNKINQSTVVDFVLKTNNYQIILDFARTCPYTEFVSGILLIYRGSSSAGSRIEGIAGQSCLALVLESFYYV